MVAEWHVCSVVGIGFCTCCVSFRYLCDAGIRFDFGEEVEACVTTYIDAAISNSRPICSPSRHQDQTALLQCLVRFE